MEQPKELVPTVVAEEKVVVKKWGEGRGGGGRYEDYSEQPVLFLTADEVTQVQARAEEEWKIGATSEENSTSELLILMQEIRDEMGGKDEQLREEVKVGGQPPR